MEIDPHGSGEDEWDHGTNWRGLGLTDPVKDVEVRKSTSYQLMLYTHNVSLQG